MISEVYNEDCLVGMKRYPDKYFDLAIVDPPYGILSQAGDRLDKYGTKHKTWDEFAPAKEYFTELVRVSKNQIIWGW
jgi:site-specific DNA-methyltransferase (adenine-specific)